MSHHQSTAISGKALHGYSPEFFYFPCPLQKNFEANYLENL